MTTVNTVKSMFNSADIFVECTSLELSVILDNDLSKYSSMPSFNTCCGKLNNIPVYIYGHLYDSPSGKKILFYQFSSDIRSTEFVSKYFAENVNMQGKSIVSAAEFYLNYKDSYMK